MIHQVSFSVCLRYCATDKNWPQFITYEERQSAILAMTATMLSRVIALGLVVLRAVCGINLRLINKCQTTVSPRYFSAESSLGGGLVLGPHSYTNLSLSDAQEGTVWAVYGGVNQCPVITMRAFSM